MPKSNPNQEVIIIGDDFYPGEQGNAEIDSLLGHTTVLLEDKAIRSDSFGCSYAPNYCGDIDLVLEELAKLDLDPQILPVQPTQKKRAKNTVADTPSLFTASFIYDDEHYLTKPFDTEELALSCALWYVLAYHH